MTGFSDATGWMKSSLASFAGETVTLRRGALVATVTAIRGSTNPKLANDGGESYIELRGAEWLIPPAEYVFDEIEEEPLPGDRLVVGTETFVATPFVAGEPCWRWSDQTKTYYRIHWELEE